MTDSKVKALKKVYLIYSDQRLLIDEALERLKKQAASQALGHLNIIEISSPADFEELEQALHTIGFFEQRRVVILHQCEKLSVNQIQKIEIYLKSPNPDAVLVLVAYQKNESLFKKAREGHYFYQYVSPKGGQINQWIVDRFRLEGKRINLETASYLVNLTGNDLSLLVNEITKIALYSGAKDNLNVDDIKAVCSNQFHETIFDLVDALGQANLSLALWHLNNLLYTESEGKIFHMVVRQFRLLLKIKGLVAQEKAPAQIAKMLRLPSFVVSKHIKQARHFNISQLAQAYSVLLETEISNKTSGSSFKQALELALIKILAA